MKRVFKYELGLTGSEQLLVMPPGARLLLVGVQRSRPVVWAECDGDIEESVGRRLQLVMTGGEVPRDGTYLGSFSLWAESSSPYVGHVYDCGEAA